MKIPGRVLPRRAADEVFPLSYPYRIFMRRTIEVMTKDAPLAMITGVDLIRTPYISHRNMPALTEASMPMERSFVDFVFQILKACGT